MADIELHVVDDHTVVVDLHGDKRLIKDLLKAVRVKASKHFWGGLAVGGGRMGVHVFHMETIRDRLFIASSRALSADQARGRAGRWLEQQTAKG